MAEARVRRQEPAPQPAAEATVTPLRERPAETGREAPGEVAKPASPPAGEAPPERARPKPKRLRRFLLLLGPVALIAVGLWTYLTGGRYVSTDNAYVKADKLAVTTDVSGIVAEVAVRDHQRVEKGQVLFRLDDEPFRIAVAGAEAQLATVQEEIATLQANYRQNLAQIAQEKTDLAFYETIYQRQLELSRHGAGTQVALDQAKRDLDAAQERVRVAERQAEATLAQLGGSVETPVEERPRYRQVKAQVDRAKRDLGHTTVMAPTNGIVANVDALQVGEYLEAAQPAFNLVAADHVWIEANPKETDLTYVKAGDPAEIAVDAYPGRDWRATVASISPATGAEFSVLPAQNASGNWVKVVQRVPVRLRVEMPEDAPPLRSGMSVEVTIDTGHKRSWHDLVETTRRWVGLE